MHAGLADVVRTPRHVGGSGREGPPVMIVHRSNVLDYLEV